MFFVNLDEQGYSTLHALQELDGGGLSLAALLACGCVISRSDFTTFMLWLQSADVHLLDKVHPDIGMVQSGLRGLSERKTKLENLVASHFNLAAGLCRAAISQF